MILRDFHCDACNERFESLMDSSADRFAACPHCGTPCEMVLSVPRLGAFSMMSKEQQASHLKKRSHDHTIKEMKKEPEKHGFPAADKRPWNIRSHSKPSS